jgi:cytoskeletal protein RodZ
VKYCPSCDEQYSDASMFCGKDGTRLETSGVHSTKGPVLRRCTACGEKLEPDAKFCPECGAPFSEETSESAPQPKTQELKPREQVGEKPGENKGDTFEDKVAAALRSSFPDAVVRQQVTIASKDGRELKTDIILSSRVGIFLIQCKNYLGKIRGSMASDYRKGELWTCQTPSDQIVGIPSEGKNPAQEAVDNVSLLREAASPTWFSRETSRIRSLLVFPDGTDLSDVAGLPVSPAKPSPDHIIAALNFSELSPYIANGEGDISEEKALRLIDALPISKGNLPGKSADSPATELKPERSFEHSSNNAEEHQDFPANVERGPSKKAVKPIYMIGGAIVVGLVLLVLFAPRLMPLLISSRTPDPPPMPPSSKPDVPDPSAPAGPGSAELSPPGSLPERTAPPSSSKVQPSKSESSPPQGPDTVVTKAIRPPPEPERETAARRSEPTVKRPDQPSIVGSGDKGGQTASSKEPAISGRPAEPGTYETTKITVARTNPSDSADVVDQIQPGTRLNVTGSQGDWLVVYSKTRNKTVYVKRDDAMLTAERSAPGSSGGDPELKWKEVERQILEAMSKRGVTGVTVSFVADTAYLRGSVQTEDQRYYAELAARTVPEVIHVHNGIWLNR